MRLPSFTLKSGQVYDSYDGKRLIYEVGCNTVIYTLINPKATTSYGFFIQSMEGFIFDVTTRSVAAKVVKQTAPIKTIVKYEMYFLLGMVSTVSTAALILVVGTDITVSGIMARQKMLAAKKLSQDLYAEQKSIAKYAPVLHSKLEEFFISESKVKWDGFSKKLPETIVNDEKTQAQLAGVLAGKAVLSPKAFTVWAAVFTILSTAVIKSATKSPEAYARTIEQKYRPVLDDLQSVDLDDPLAAAQAAVKFRKILLDSGVSVSDQEVLAILREVSSNSTRLEKSLVNINRSFHEFSQSIKNDF